MESRYNLGEIQGGGVSDGGQSVTCPPPVHPLQLWGWPVQVPPAGPPYPYTLNCKLGPDKESDIHIMRCRRGIEFGHQGKQSNSLNRTSRRLFLGNRVKVVQVYFKMAVFEMSE